LSPAESHQKFQGGEHFTPGVKVVLHYWILGALKSWDVLENGIIQERDIMNKLKEMNKYQKISKDENLTKYKSFVHHELEHDREVKKWFQKKSVHPDEHKFYPEFRKLSATEVNVITEGKRFNVDLLKDADIKKYAQNLLGLSKEETKNISLKKAFIQRKLCSMYPKNFYHVQKIA